MKGVFQSGHWPSGNPRLYLRRAGHKHLPLPDLPKDHPQLIAAWAAATGTAPAAIRPATGTIGAMTVAFLASARFMNLAPSTRAYMARALDAIRTTWGAARAGDLRTSHILTDLAKLAPNPANQKLKTWRALCGWAFQESALIPSDPSATIRKRSTPKTDGHTPWSDADVAAFRARWPHGTAQRLAMELILHTGASIVDAMRIGPGMVRDGWLTYARQKTGTVSVCPMTAATAPGWFGMEPHLDRCLSCHPRHMVYLATAAGHPRSHKAASQWLTAAARQAGLHERGAHGLRKRRAEIMMERGASADQRMAILGHDSRATTHAYSKGADLIRVITGTHFANSPDQTANFAAQVIDKSAV